MLAQAFERITREGTSKDEPLPLVEELAEMVTRVVEDDPYLKTARKDAG